MIRPLAIFALVFLVPAISPGQDIHIERLTISLDYPQAVVRVADRTLYLSSAPATTPQGEGEAWVYRWVVSVADPADVSFGLEAPEWEPLDESPDWPARLTGDARWRVHSPQVWRDVHVVMVDLIPWRQVNGKLEVLRGGTAHLTLRQHGPQSEARAPGPDLLLANKVRVPFIRKPGSPAKALDPLPTGGQWLKIPISNDGLHRVTAQYLSDAGVAVSGLDLPALRLFAPSSMGRPIDSRVGAPIPENMIELPLLVRDGGDGSLDSPDDIVFFAQGPRGTDFNAGALVHAQNPYANTAYVWLHLPLAGGQAGLRIADGPAYDGALTPLTSGRTLYHHEVDVFNGFESGPVWHQIAILRGGTFNLSAELPNLRNSDTTNLRIRVRGGKETSHRVEVFLNQTSVFRSPFFAGNDDRLYTAVVGDVTAAARAGQNLFTIGNINSGTSSREEVWFDWWEIEYSHDLTAEDDRLDAAIPARGNAANVQLSGFSAEPLVLDITDPAAPVHQLPVSTGSSWTFTPGDLSAGRRFVAATTDQLTIPDAPVLLPSVSFTDLRQTGLQADYIIITLPVFQTQGEALARIHRQEVRPEWQLTVKVVLIDEIYEEFSGGVGDPYAIRAFLRYAYDNWAAPAPRLVALLGDGDYDYRNISGLSQQLLPTVQVDGRNEINSRSADDRFVYLDSVFVAVPLPDMGIGRIPVSTVAEAEAVVEAVRNYMVTPEPGPWRQRITMAADDPVRPNNNEPSFIRDTESFIKDFPPFLELSKVYLTEFAEERDPITHTIIKPGATEALLDKINRGLALVNFIGHGSATQWAQEALLKVDRDRPVIQPGNKLPAWYAGTCAWGRYDLLEAPAMSELLTANEDIGGIVVISATRAVFSVDNTNFVRRLFANTFPNNMPATARIGEILQASKLDDDDEKFHLFGDPAIRLAFPSTPLDSLAIMPDTLQVLGTGTYTGRVNGAFSSGRALVTILDAPVAVTRTYRTLLGSILPIQYNLPGAPLFRGTASIIGGTFTGEFIIPKDINYSGNDIKAIAYAWSDAGDLLLEQASSINNLVIQGTAATTLDSIGPLISFYHDNRLLQNDESVPRGSELVVEIQDPLGINLTGEIGHRVRLWLDDEADAKEMNDLFQYDLDKHTTGRFDYTLDEDLSGRHEIVVEAWDGANNRTRESLAINLDLASSLDATTLLNYPNPFGNQTRFFYVLSVPAQVTITIYTLNGVKVHTLESLDYQDPGPQRLPDDGQWDGTDWYGDPIANGTYLYRFRAETPEGQSIVLWGRLARLR